MANWTWSVEDTISGVPSDGAFSRMNSLPSGTRDQASRNVFVTLRYTSDNPADQPILETIWGVNISQQSIADKGYGRCNALKVSDDAQAALLAELPTPEKFGWSMPSPDAAIAKDAAMRADADLLQKSNKIAALISLAENGVTIDPAIIQAAKDDASVAVTAATNANDALKSAVAAAPPIAQPVVAG